MFTPALFSPVESDSGLGQCEYSNHTWMQTKTTAPRPLRSEIWSTYQVHFKDLSLTAPFLLHPRQVWQISGGNILMWFIVMHFGALVFFPFCGTNQARGERLQVDELVNWFEPEQIKCRCENALKLPALLHCRTVDNSSCEEGKKWVKQTLHTQAVLYVVDLLSTTEFTLYTQSKEYKYKELIWWNTALCKGFRHLWQIIKKIAFYKKNSGFTSLCSLNILFSSIIYCKSNLYLVL